MIIGNNPVKKAWCWLDWDYCPCGCPIPEGTTSKICGDCEKKYPHWGWRALAWSGIFAVIGVIAGLGAAITGLL